MNILLWILQVALAWFCIGGGAFQIFKIQDLEKTTAAMRELPHALWAVLGALSCIEGLLLIVPGAIKLMPQLTPMAALAVAAQSVLISVFYVIYGDRAPLPYVIVMAALGAFIAYGRFVLKPF